MKKYYMGFVAICAAFVLSACAPGGNVYSDDYRSPWDMAQTSQDIQTAEATNQAERLEPQVDWRNSANIQNNIELEMTERATGAQVEAVEAHRTYERRAVDQNQHQQQASPSVTPARPAGARVKVALLVPLSGEHEAIGNALLNAAQLALFDVGSENFELIPRDTRGTPEGAQQAARSAAQDGANLILGPLFSDSVTAIKPIARARNIPVISFSTDWNVAGNNTYIMGFLPFAQVARVTNYAIAQGHDRVALFAPQGQYSEMVGRTLESVLQSQGSSIAKREIYAAQSNEDIQQAFAQFVEHERRAQNDYADNRLPFNALMLPVGGDSLRTLAAYVSMHNIDTRTTKLLGTGLWDDASLNGEPTLYGAWFAAPDPALRRNFERSYQETYGQRAPRIASLAYDGTALAAILAQSAGDINPRDVYTQQRLTSNRGFAGIDGIFRFNENGLIERGLAVQEITRQGPRIIDPAPTAFMARQRT